MPVDGSFHPLFDYRLRPGGSRCVQQAKMSLFIACAVVTNSRATADANPLLEVHLLSFQSPQNRTPILDGRKQKFFFFLFFFCFFSLLTAAS